MVIQRVYKQIKNMTYCQYEKNKLTLYITGSLAQTSFSVL